VYKQHQCIRVAAAVAAHQQHKSIIATTVLAHQQHQPISSISASAV
jgi:hypothetical protein